MTLGAGSGRLFHGGHPGLEVGDLLQPPALTGATAYEHVSVRRDRVYCTGDLPLAMTLGARPRADVGRRAGAVYEVEPVGLLERDPYGDNDYWTGQLFACTVPGAVIARPASGSWMTPAARVVRVVATDVRLSGLAFDAFLDAGDMVGELSVVQGQDPTGFAHASRLMAMHDGRPTLRRVLAGVLGWPDELEPSGLGDPDGWLDCRPGHRRWGTCGGAELRWMPGALTTTQVGRPCAVSVGPTSLATMG